MAQSQIEWTDATWNPVVGCSIMSAGCQHCYAMNLARRLEFMGMEKYKGLTHKRGNRIAWNGQVREDYDSLAIPYIWKKPRNIFVNSMSDLFHDKVSDNFIREVWDVMHATPQHNYQILTKRPERMKKILYGFNEVLANVWLGTSVESKEVIGRVSHLRNTPAAVRFISFEPLIGDVGAVNLKNIHWVIVGGESGVNARPIKERWIDKIHDRCRKYETAFFFKQWGAWGDDNKKRSKKANGRVYRGQTWDEMPQIQGGSLVGRPQVVN